MESHLPFPTFKRSVPLDAAIYTWCLRTALHNLLDCERYDLPLPSLDELDLDLFDLARKLAGENVIVGDYDGNKIRPTKGQIKMSHLERQTHNAAERALEVYDPEFLWKAKLGGQHSRRGPSTTLADLEALPVGLTVAEQARRLGVSRQTIYNIHRRAADEVHRRRHQWDYLLEGTEDSLHRAR